MYGSGLGGTCHGSPQTDVLAKVSEHSVYANGLSRLCSEKDAELLIIRITPVSTLILKLAAQM